jgi:hydroxyacylglutathione hydrolase
MKPLPSEFSGHLAHSKINEGTQPVVVQFEISSAQNFVYLILDWQTHSAAWVDPQKDLSEPLKLLEQYGFTLRWILLTHNHWDHVAGVAELAEKFPKVPIALHTIEARGLKTGLKQLPQLHFLNDGDQIKLGETAIQVLHTPGHSAGEVCYWLKTSPESFLLTGDTVFIRDCGRTDLPTGNALELFESLQRIKKLPPETILLPGHHYQKEVASRLATELLTSPPFLCTSFEEFERIP